MKSKGIADRNVRRHKRDVSPGEDNLNGDRFGLCSRASGNDLLKEQMTILNNVASRRLRYLLILENVSRR